jgi:hypothetical protein
MMMTKPINLGKARLLLFLVPVFVLMGALARAPLSATASPMQLPTGMYITTIIAADLPPDYPPEFIPLTTGQWELEFTESGTLVITKEGAIVVEALYTSNPARVVITDLQGPFACVHQRPGATTGVYAWAFSGDELTFEAVHDSCVGRPEVLTSSPLQKQ